MSDHIDNEPMTTQAGTGSRVFVWDIPVRLFHWSLVVLMIALFITGEVMDGVIGLHAKLGQAVLVLVLFRLMWGVVGSSYARFTQFVYGPGTVISYLRSLMAQRHEFIPGHNPLGGWMVVVLLIIVTTQTMLGLFANDDVMFDGPLAYLVSKEASDILTGLHKDLFGVLMVLVGLHVAAVVWHMSFKGENLIPAMFTGYKKLPPGAAAENASGGGAFLAMTLFISSIAIVFWLSQ